MAIYYLMIGAPGSGKSTQVQSLERQGTVVICPDIIRDAQKISIPESYVVAKRQIVEAFQANKNVVLDATNARPASRRSLIDTGKPYAEKVVAIWMDTPFELCVKRHSKRLENGPVSERYTTEVGDKPYEAVIKEYCQLLSDYPPNFSEGFAEIRRVKP